MKRNYGQLSAKDWAVITFAECAVSAKSASIGDAAAQRRVSAAATSDGSLSRIGSRIARWYDIGTLHHENDGLLGGARAMLHALRHHERLALTQLDATIFEVDQKPSADDLEKLVEQIVLVPVVLALHDTEPHDRFVYLTERLVIPGMCVRRDERRDADQHP